MFKKIEQLIAEYNLDITTHKYGSKIENFHHQLLSHNSLRIVLRKKFQTSFLEEWDVKTSSTSKLSFYRLYKQNHKLENYIVLVNNRRHRSALAKLTCSTHRLKKEIGRYSRVYSEETNRHEQMPREKRTCDTCKDKVEDEHHFLLECSLNEGIHNNFFQKLYKIMTEDIQLWSDTDKINYLFSTTDESVINCFVKFVFDSLKKNTENTQHTYKRKTDHSSK